MNHISVQKAWTTLKREAGVDGLQMKDLRTFCNYRLIHVLGFTHKETGAYLGNSEIINHRHYTPVSAASMREKIERSSVGIVPMRSAA